MKPVVWINKANGKIRFDGKDLSDSWIPLYARDDLEIEPLKIYENPDLPEKTQRILAYIKTLKQPVKTATIANQFAISQSAAAKHMSTLRRANLVSKKRIGAQVVWPLVKTEQPKAEPVLPKEEPVLKTFTHKPEVNKYVWPTSSFTTSYPHARGYDD